MLYFSKIKIFFVALIATIFILLTVSNFFNINNSLIKKKINLGLDLQGGSYLLLEIDNKGLLKSKTIYDLNKMNKYKFSENTTQNSYQKNSYIYGVLTSLREKINAPAKRKKVSK